jgi:hypothetical protein
MGCLGLSWGVLGGRKKRANSALLRDYRQLSDTVIRSALSLVRSIRFVMPLHGVLWGAMGYREVP